jgi:hypothetical protein
LRMAPCLWQESSAAPPDPDPLTSVCLQDKHEGV